MTVGVCHGFMANWDILEGVNDERHGGGWKRSSSGKKSGKQSGEKRQFWYGKQLRVVYLD